MAVIITLMALLASWARASEPVIDVNEPVRLRKVESGRFVSVILENRLAYDVTVKLTIRSRNARIQWLRPETETYRPSSETEVARISAAEPNGRYAWQARFHWTKGSTRAQHDEDAIYHLPYRKGTSCKVTQGHNGKLSHHGPDRYAVDFAMKEGTLVCAARAGIVVDLRESSDVGGPRKSYRDHSNFVSIAHADGTIGEYYHLKQDGVLVKIGQAVAAGEVIARSGDTGYSTHPHLHFGVYSALNATEIQSHPVTFVSRQGLVSTPVVGRYYMAK